MLVSLFLDPIILINLNLYLENAYSLGTLPPIKDTDAFPQVADYTSLKMYYSMKLDFLILICSPNQILVLLLLMESLYPLSHSCLHMFLLSFLYLHLLPLLVICLKTHSLLLVLLSNLLLTLPLPGMRPFLVPHLKFPLLNLSLFPLIL